MSTYRDLETHLISYLKGKLPTATDLQVSSLIPLSKGWETDLFAFDLNYIAKNREIIEKLIIRIFPNYEIKNRVKWEFEVISSLFDIGYPVPKVFYLEIENNPIGRPFLIMERIIGRDQGELFFSLATENKQEEIVEKILPIFTKLFVSLHKLDWKILPTTLKNKEEIASMYFVERFLSYYKKEIKQNGFSELEPILFWLEENKHKGSCHQISILHRDFHPHNIIVSEKNDAFVIDWAGSSVGDFRSDLAWTLVLVSAYLNEEMRDIILNFYEQEFGSKVDSIDYFEVLAILRRFTDVMSIIRQGPESIGMREESLLQIQETVFHLQNIYNQLIKKTGLKIIKLEKWIKSLSNSN